MRGASIGFRRGGRRRGQVHGAALAAAALGLLLLEAPAPAQERRGPVVRVLDLDGIVSPFSARYLERELRRAELRGDEAVVVRLDTPGGLLESTRAITQAMLAARVPVLVYVSPSGARAASAGMFVLVAGHVAAMAPGTHVGAAHPVQAGGQDLGEVMNEKVVNDAAAMARALAAARGRDPAWPEEAVRKSVSATAEEASELGVIDLVAVDLDALLAAVHGRTVVTASGPTRLDTRDAIQAPSAMSVPERLLQAVVHPNVAYLLFTIGLIGIVAELYAPGTLFPGITGTIALLLAFAGFGVLPVSWAGVALILVGVALVAVELATEGVGLLGVGGVAAFVAGSLLLYRPSDPVAPALPDVRVSGWLVAALAAGMAVFFAVVGRALLRTRDLPVASGRETLVGRTGTATSDLRPEGTVSLDQESWSAVAADGGISRGERVRVLAVDGVRLRVARAATARGG
jgi:membrane-bound serine protease (ClpP class)